MNLTTRQIEVFLCIAEQGSFARAAFDLDISQPAISNHMAALEAELGCRLFIRRPGSPPVLSTDGEIFATEARRFLGAARSLSQPPRAGQTTRVRICTGGHILDRFVKPALAAFQAANPAITLIFTEQQVGSTMPDLAQTQFDCALAVLPACPQDPETCVLATMSAGLYGLADHRGIASGGADPHFILPAEGSAETAIVLRHLRAAGFANPQAAAHAQYPAVAVQMALRGAGLAPLLDSMARHHDPAAALVRLMPLPDWYLCLSLSPRLPQHVHAALLGFFQSIETEPASPPQASGREPILAVCL